MPKNKKIFLIDGSSYVYRAFYAIRHLATSDGFPTNAVYGFTTMILKVINDYKPDYMAIVFDTKEPTFRDEIYPEYKANRSQAPDELIMQIPHIKKVVEAFNIPSIEKHGFEADDIIGTIARMAEKKGFDTVIITGDKDMVQLVSDKVTLLDTMKNKTTGVNEVKERFGVTPDKVIDIFGLSGDTSDNIPGVPGIGEKTAMELIKEFGSVENLIKSADKITRDKLRENIKQNTEKAILSKKLFTIKIDVPLDIELDSLKQGTPDTEKLRSIFTELEFGKFIKELAPAKRISHEGYSLILNKSDFEDLIKSLEKADCFAVDLETTSTDPIDAEIVGISFSCQTDKAFYIPVGHDYEGAPKQLDIDYVIGKIKPLLENKSIRKIGQNIKYDLAILKKYGVDIKDPISDTMIASYLLNPAKHNHNLEELSREYLEHQIITYKDVAGTGKKEIGFNKVPVEIAGDYSAEDANIAYLLDEILIPKLNEANLYKIYEELELPLVHVLAQMELAGIKVDKKMLEKLSSDFEIRLDKIRRTLYKLVPNGMPDGTGKEFNLDSPKQLQVILYDKLGLKRGKKIKTGFSTDSDTLSKLAQEHEFPEQLLEYRALTKLKSTYLDALALLINKKTLRVHTSYNQTVTATGRLSSSDPNLQNIPIRTEEGRKIRQAFIPEKGCIFIAADYSQIELRLLAHLSKDESLIEAFKNDEDIHSHTASEIFNVKSEAVTDEMRRMAKTINFGIIYGMSAHGLAMQLKISHEMAQAYIDNYFARYPRVKDYFETVIADCQENGYVQTLMGRKRFFSEMNSSNPTVRGFAERAAINAPLQGSAADIMKKAMINIYKKINSDKLKTKMVLQVHDEMIFESPKEEKDKIVNLALNEMEGVIKLSVPLKVDVSYGENWGALETIENPK
jgi:DNA polymerase-1